MSLPCMSATQNKPPEPNQPIALIIGQSKWRIDCMLDNEIFLHPSIYVRPVVITSRHDFIRLKGVGFHMCFGLEDVLRGFHDRNWKSNIELEHFKRELVETIKAHLR